MLRQCNRKRGGAEMLRVLRGGGVLSYVHTLWLTGAGIVLLLYKSPWWQQNPPCPSHRGTSVGRVWRDGTSLRFAGQRRECPAPTAPLGQPPSALLSSPARPLSPAGPSEHRPCPVQQGHRDQSNQGLQIFHTTVFHIHNSISYTEQCFTYIEHVCFTYRTGLNLQICVQACGMNAFEGAWWQYIWWITVAVKWTYSPVLDFVSVTRVSRFTVEFESKSIPPCERAQ